MDILKFTQLVRKNLNDLVDDLLDLLEADEVLRENPRYDRNNYRDYAKNFILLFISHLEQDSFDLHLDYIGKLLADNFSETRGFLFIHRYLVTLRHFLMEFAKNSGIYDQQDVHALRESLVPAVDRVVAHSIARYSEFIRQNADEAFAGSARNTEAVLGAFDFPVVVIDREMKVLYMNRAAELEFGISADRIRRTFLSSAPVFLPIMRHSGLFTGASDSYEKQTVKKIPFLLPAGRRELDVTVYPYAENLVLAGYVVTAKSASAPPPAPRPDRPREKFGAAVRRIRNARNMTIKELAGAVGVSRSYFSNIERSKILPSQSVIERIAAELDPDGGEDLLMHGVREKAPDPLKKRLE